MTRLLDAHNVCDLLRSSMFVVVYYLKLLI